MFLEYEKVDVIDKKRALVYPEIGENEKRMEIVKNDILKVLKSESHYFPLDFRMENIVINSIAKKYFPLAEDYPSPDDLDEPRFLIGMPLCQKDYIYQLKCPYMKKVLHSISDNNAKGINNEFIINPDNIVAIYILKADKSEDYHKQGFLILSKDGIYLRNTSESYKINHYDYSDLRFTLDGIAHLDRIDVEGLLLDYSLDENFILFAQEFMLLRRTTLMSIRARHPFADAMMEFRESYMEILIDVAAGEGKLTVEKYIRLEYIAREFKISPEDFKKWLFQAYKGDGSVSDVQQKLKEMLNDKTKTTEWYVLFQDILELAVGEDDEVNRKKLIDMLRRKSSAGSEFVSNYIEFIKYRRKSEMSLYRAIESIGYRNLADNLGGYLKNIHTLQTYNNEMNLKLLDIGVLVNEK